MNAMLTSLFNKCRTKQLKLRVWNNRLQKQWRLLAPEISPWVNCSLDVNWGPFYSGAMLIDRRFKKAKLIVQIPYDGYLTVDEQQILTRFSLTKSALPYFIFYHEVSHLLDIMPFIRCSDHEGLLHYIASHKQMAAAAASYKDLSFEERADRYAHRMVMKNGRQAG